MDQKSIDLTILTKSFSPFKYNPRKKQSENEDMFRNHQRPMKIERLGEIKEILEKENSDIIKDIQFIPKAKVPLVNFKWKGIDIDITIDNYEGYYNSQLLLTFFSVHEKIRYFVYYIKEMHKENKLIANLICMASR